VAVRTAAVILDTNVFVAAGFKPGSASARTVDQVRSGELRLVWNDAVRRETQHVLSKIPRLSWPGVEELFREEGRYGGDTFPERFDYIEDPDDRKFAALAEATGVVLVTSDDHLLSNRDRAGLQILTPRELWSSDNFQIGFRAVAPSRAL
jgi:predicted nucleic acid-binding protein